jgi:hypothetical protein
MRTKLITLSFVVIFIASNVLAGSSTLLRLNLKKGTTYEMTMITNTNIDQAIMGQNMKVDQKMEMVCLYKVMDVLPNKNFLIEYSIAKVKMNMSMNGNEMNVDSESPDTTNAMNSLSRGLVSKKMTIELNRTGKVERIEGLDSFIKQSSANPLMAQSLKMFSNDSSFISYIGQTFNYFPKNEVKKGDKWSSSYKLPAMMNMAISMNFEVADIIKNQITLNVNSDVNVEAPIEQMGQKINIKVTGTQNGNIAIDASDGWLRSSNLVQKLDMKMIMKNPQSGEEMEIPIVLNSVSKIAVLKK